MKRIILLSLFAASGAFAADRELGQLPTGQFYIKDEVQFCLKADAARALSPAGLARRSVPPTGLAALHPSIERVVGNHLSASNWLNGLALPAALRHSGNDVPAIARSLTAMLVSGADAAVVVEELRQHPDIEWASLNLLHPVTHVPNDPLWTNQWGPLRVRATNGWDVVPPSTLRIAVIDTGVDLFHPDLAGRIVYNRGFAGNVSGDAMRDARGGSSIDHGTHVAGIAAAIRDNNIGIAGIANASIMAMGCAVWAGGTNNQYQIGSAVDALNDAVANAAQVINCSFGQLSPLSAAMQSALDNAQNNGVIVVCAAGNDGTNIVNSESAGWAAHGWPFIVSNVRMGDALASDSNFGNRIDLAAPGSSILSTATTNYLSPSAGGTYTNMSGTSMASPHVAGAAAFVRSMSTGLIFAVGTKDLLIRMAEDIGPAGKDQSFGFGMLNLPSSMLKVLRFSTGFAGANSTPWVPNGSYDRPFATIPSALSIMPAGGTLVLNGGVGGALPSYPPQTISTPVTLTAFPDRPITIGN